LKKLIIACEILILFIFFAKIVAAVGIIKSSGAVVDHFLSVEQASADSPAADSRNFSGRDMYGDSLLEERELASSLVNEQKELQDREVFLKSEEKRLNSLKDEILSKFAELRIVEEKLSGFLEQIKEIRDERYKNLAKVYESTPPAQASAMLEKLDKKTAAAIIMNMKAKKAGEIWGYVDPQKGVEITKEITSIDCFSKTIP
jgi:flagellar motility protein MotE (MotC chaperone)